MLNLFKKYKISNFTGRINAFQEIERLERMNILVGQNTKSVKSFVTQMLFGKFCTAIY